MPRWKRVIRHGTRPAEDTIALPSADDAPVELWTTGFDALSAQAAPEGVVHKSTGVMPGIALRNDLRVFAGEPLWKFVGRTRGCSGSMSVMEISIGALDAGAEDHRSGGCRPRSRSRISRLKARYLSGRARHLGQSSGCWLRWRQRNPLAFRGAQRQDQAAAEAGGSGSGPMACGRVSLRMKMSRPW